MNFFIQILAPFLVPLGISGGIIGVILYLPQVIKAFKTKHTKDIALMTYLLILINDIVWTLYGLGLDNYLIYIPNGISIGLCSIILFQKHLYDRKSY